jgi:CRP-like cAMP-binding protein
MDAAEFLAQVSIFSHMSKADLKGMAKQAQYHQFQEGEVIIREGERDNRLFVVVSGQVDIIKGLGGKNERHLATFGPNAYFGEMALIDDLARSASVITRMPTQILSLQRWDLRQGIEKSADLAMELLKMLSRRVRATEAIMYQTLKGFLPICANCKNIREDNGSWTPIEDYISRHSEAEFSHGICPECAKRLYPEFIPDMQPG